MQYIEVNKLFILEFVLIFKFYAFWPKIRMKSYYLSYIILNVKIHLRYIQKYWQQLRWSLYFKRQINIYWLQQPLWDNVLLIYVHCSSLLVFTLLAERNEESGWIVLVKQSDAFRWHQRSHRGPSPTGITFTLFWHLSLSNFTTIWL